MKKCFGIIAFFLFFSSLSFVFATETVKIGVIKGLSSASLVWLLEKNELLETNLEYDFSFYENPKDMMQDLLLSNISCAVLSSFSAYKIQEKAPSAISVCASLSTIDFVLAGKTKGNISYDLLKGKTVCVPGNGFAKEVFEYLLKENLVESSDEVNILIAENQNECVQKLKLNQADFAVLSGIQKSMLTSRSKRFFVNLDFQSEYELLNGEKRRLPKDVIVCSTLFIKKDEGIVFEQFISDVNKSVQKTNEQKRKTSALCKKHGILSGADSDYAVFGSHFSFQRL